MTETKAMSRTDAAFHAGSQDEIYRVMAEMENELAAIHGKQTATNQDMTPRTDSVICPGCCHQFVAIPLDVQAELAKLRRQ